MNRRAIAGPRLMPIDRRFPVAIAAALLAFAVLFSASGATAAGPASSPAVTAPASGPSAAKQAKPPPTAEDLDTKEFERFIRRNPGVLIGGVALPLILLLTVLARRRHYLWFSVLIGAVAGAACQTIPLIGVIAASPLSARLVQSATAAVVALLCALWFDLMFFIARLANRLILGKPLQGPDPVREWFRNAVLVRRWTPARDKTHENDDAVERWHIALVTGAGALVATVLIQGHFFAGLREHFNAAGFLTTSVILVAALYILEPVRERILHLANPGHAEEAARDSLVRSIVDSPRQGWLLSVVIVVGALLVQVLIIGLEEAINKAEPSELLELAFSGLGPMPIAYFLCAALQQRLELKRAVLGTSAFFALLVFSLILVIVPILSVTAAGMAAYFAKTALGSGAVSIAIIVLAGIAIAVMLLVMLFWLSLGVSLLVGFIFSGLIVWIMQVLWSRTRGVQPFASLALAIIIATVLESLVAAPLHFWMLEPGEPGNVLESLIAEPLTTAAGWIVGLWLSGIAGVLETYQKARSDLFATLKE